MTNKLVWNKHYNTYTQQPEMFQEAKQLNKYTFCFYNNVLCYELILI